MLYVPLSQGIYTIIVIFDYCKPENVADTIIASQIITIFTINWIIAHP